MSLLHTNAQIDNWWPGREIHGWMVQGHMYVVYLLLTGLDSKFIIHEEVMNSRWLLSSYVINPQTFS